MTSFKIVYQAEPEPHFLVKGLTKITRPVVIRCKNSRWTIIVKNPQLGDASLCLCNSLPEALCYLKLLEGPDSHFETTSSDLSFMVNELGGRFSRYSQYPGQMGRDRLHLCLHLDASGQNLLIRCSFIGFDGDGLQHIYRLPFARLLTEPFGELCQRARSQIDCERCLEDESDLRLPTHRGDDEQELLSQCETVIQIFYSPILMAMTDDPLLFVLPGSESGRLCCYDLAADIEPIFSVNRQSRVKIEAIEADKTAICYLLNHLDDEFEQDRHLLNGLDRRLASGVFKHWADSFPLRDYERLEEREQLMFVTRYRIERIDRLFVALENYIKDAYISGRQFPQEWLAPLLQRESAFSRETDDYQLADAMLMSLSDGEPLQRLVKHVRDQFFMTQLTVRAGEPWLELFEGLSDKAQLYLVETALRHHFDFDNSPFAAVKRDRQLFSDAMKAFHDELEHRQYVEGDNYRGSMMTEYSLSGKPERRALRDGEFKDPLTRKTLSVERGVDGKVFQQLILAALYRAAVATGRGLSALGEDLEQFIGERLEDDINYLAKGEQYLMAYLYFDERFNFNKEMLAVLDQLGIKPVSSEQFLEEAALAESATRPRHGFFQEAGTAADPSHDAGESPDGQPPRAN